MSTPLFSVVIPTYNRSELVGSAIHSVLRQTCKDFEIIVCDNCSTDETPRVVTRLADGRLKYVRTPRHLFISDNWEFGRSHATGRLILILADDDALVATALERFAGEAERHDADFLMCRVADYRDRGFPGPTRNILECPPFLGSSRIIQVDEFVEPLFAFRPLETLDYHPSCFVFAKTLADSIASRCGRFFKTNGVEFFAWPLAAVFTKRSVYIDAPLAIAGRTAKSWGANVVLGNPGKERIDALISDADHERHCAPLRNFTIPNMMAEGMLMAKKLFPREFERFEFDEREYLRRTFYELRDRRSLGVDVSKEMDEFVRYSDKYPSLKGLLSDRTMPKGSLVRRTRHTIGRLGGHKLQRQIQALQETWKVRRGEVHSGFVVSGDDFGFNDILGCAEFLARITSSSPEVAGRQSPPYSV